MTPTPAALRLGFAASVTTAALLVAYAVCLTLGLLSLPSPDEPIGDPWFTVLEILILAMVPGMVAWSAAVHTTAPAPLKPLSLTALVFMGLLAGVTSVVHFSVLTLSRQAGFAGQPWSARVFEFRWPSLVYALDILAWDVLFPLAVLFAAPVFSGARLAVAIRWLMVASGALAFAGLGGVVSGDMQVRNLGIVGYVGVYLVVLVLTAVFFSRAARSIPPAVRDSSIP